MTKNATVPLVSRTALSAIAGWFAKRFVRLFCLLALLVLLSRGFAQDLIVSFPEAITSLAVQANGQIVVGHSVAITRLNEDGGIDVTFPVTLYPSVLGIENDVSVLAASFSSPWRFSVEGAQKRFSFPAGFVSFVVQPDSKLVVLTPRLSRLNGDGTLDGSFAPSSPSAFRGILPPPLALQEDGKILMMGETNRAVLRFNPAGTPDALFHSPLFDSPFANAILVQADGRILVGGSFRTVDGLARGGLVRLNPDGSLDANFNPAPEAVYSLALQANGKILLAGPLESIGGQPVTNVARLNPDGTLDLSFPAAAFAGGILPGLPIALQKDGAVLAGIMTNLVRMVNPEKATESFTQEGSTLTWLRGGSSPEIFFARFQASLDGVTWMDLGAGRRITGGWQLQGATIPEGARLRMRGYVSGSSYYVDFLPGAPGILAHPTDRTNNVNTASAFEVMAEGNGPLNFQWLKNGFVLSGALSSTLVLSDVTGADAGGYSVIVSNAEGASTSRVAQLTVLDPVILKQPSAVWLNGGKTLTLNITAAGTGLSYEWKKDGQEIPGATSSTLLITNAGSVHTGSYQVLVKGTYGTLQSDVAAVHVNFALPDAWNPNYEATLDFSPIQAVALQGNEMFVGGFFKTPDPPSRLNLVKLEPTGTVDLAFAPDPSGSALSDGVTTLTVVPNGQILVGGTFLRIAGKSQRYLARLQPDGTLDEQFKPVIDGIISGMYTNVAAIEVQPDGRILVAGNFSSVNGQRRPGVARLFSDGTLDDSFNPDTNSVPPVSWGLLPQPDGKIIVYGWDLRRLNPDGTPDADFTQGIVLSSFGNVFLLPDGKLFTDGPTRLNSNGTLDPGFTPAISGDLQALQADGKMIISHSFPSPTANQYGLFRLNPDGIEDPSFSPVLDNYVLVNTMQADGSFILGGRFATLAGEARPGLARLKNTEPATQSLAIGGGTATWLRSGTSPEVTRTSFEFSADDYNWTDLGPGVRIAGGWQLGGLQLPAQGTLRARGFLKGSIYEATIDIPFRPRLQTTAYNPGSAQITLNVSLASGNLTVLEVSPDLRQWMSLQTNLIGTQPFQLSLTNVSSPRAFYRLRETAN
ncbi:MAG TPA: hypothetical protein VGR78_12830 [Verrucomicrobiae bacterium]|nr:hypothetical protein [Verrucomicrobiae bacterium]